MDSKSRTLPEQPIPPSIPPQRSRLLQRLRVWLRTRNGRILLPIVTFLLGLLLAIGGLLIYALAISHDVSPLPGTTQSAGAIIVQVSPTYIAEIAQQNLSASGMPGTVQNVRASMTQNGPLTITGDDQFSFLGISVSRHFTIQLQPYVNACQLQVHILHADLNGIAVTGLVSAFENQINQELRVKVSELPQGFTYCTVGVRTDPQGLFVVYAVTSIASPTAKIP